MPPWANLKLVHGGIARTHESSWPRRHCANVRTFRHRTNAEAVLTTTATRTQKALCALHQITAVNFRIALEIVRNGLLRYIRELYALSLKRLHIWLEVAQIATEHRNAARGKRPLPREKEASRGRADAPGVFTHGLRIRKRWRLNENQIKTLVALHRANHPLQHVRSFETMLGAVATVKSQLRRAPFRDTYATSPPSTLTPRRPRQHAPCTCPYMKTATQETLAIGHLPHHFTRYAVDRGRCPCRGSSPSTSKILPVSCVNMK